ncbi:MAG: type VII toxin-antitoxin system HepT family RNase toxin [Syntrophobacteria bacterium]
MKRQQEQNRETFVRDFRSQLIVERAFQAAIECCIDTASHVISVYGLERPEEQRDLFLILGRAGYFDEEYVQAMSAMVSFRNRLVHLYWDVDPGRLYQYLQEDLGLLERFRDWLLQLIEVAREKHE